MHLVLLLDLTQSLLVGLVNLVVSCLPFDHIEGLGIDGAAELIKMQLLVGDEDILAYH